MGTHRVLKQYARTVMFVRVEPITLTWPVEKPPEILTSPPPPRVACIAHAAQARGGAHPHRFATMGTSGTAEGYADTVDSSALRPVQLRARNATEAQRKPQSFLLHSTVKQD